MMLTGGPCRFLQKLYKNVTVKVGAFDIQSRPAIVWKDRNKNKRVATYRDLLSDSQQLAKQIIDIKKSVGKRGIGYIENDNYISNGRIIGLDEGKYNYVKALFASFLSSSAFVPLAINHPPAEWNYYIENSDPFCAIYGSSFAPTLSPLIFEKFQFNKFNIGIMKNDIKEEVIKVMKIKGNKKITAIELGEPNPPHIYENKRILDPYLFFQSDKHQGLMIYTSGTTGKPKGVVLTTNALDFQLDSLNKAWGWTKEDQIANCLPLHHINGIVNVVMSSMNAGSALHLLGKFNVKEVWDYLIEEKQLTIFMAVPTIYAKMYDYYEEANAEQQMEMREACARLRLMVSGSSALPIPLMEKWEKMSTHRLLERYGMSELGMALSNSLKEERYPGRVGKELPYVTVRLVDNNEKEVTRTNEAGELRVKSFGIFSDYWKKEGEYQKSFDKYGWFKTGDVALRDEKGAYQILGRNSVDILKVGGYKISALEIESLLLSHPLISSCAVLGKEDEKYGQEICAVIVLKKEATVTGEEISEWAKDKIAPYKIPRQFIFRDEIPVNAMGKVNKKSLAASLFSPSLPNAQS